MRRSEADLSLASPAAKIFAAGERMNQLLVAHIDEAAWDARPSGNVRRIPAIFAHMHNVRCKWLRLSAPRLAVPAQLSRAHLSRDQASESLSASARRCEEMLEEAIGTRAGSVKLFHRDGWAAAWPVGLEMLSYMLSHESHHRGQISMLAHQLGCPLPKKLTSRLWNWDELWKELGSPQGPGH